MLLMGAGAGCSQFQNYTDKIRVEYQRNFNNYIEVKEIVYGNELKGTAGKTEIWLFISEKYPKLKETLVKVDKDVMKLNDMFSDFTNKEMFDANSKITTALNYAITAVKVYSEMKQ